MRRYSVLIFLLLSVLACAIFRHDLVVYVRRIPDPAIDLILYIAGGILTAFLSILSYIMAVNRPIYRLLFGICGVTLSAIVIVSGVRNYRAALAAKTPEQIVEEANGHTDAIVKDANKHTDGKFDDMNGKLGSLSALVSKTAIDLNKSIGKVSGNPRDLARLQLSLWGDGQLGSHFPISVYGLKADKDGVFTVDFTFRNISGVIASKIDLWVQLCNVCIFSEEPSGFDKPPGTLDDMRHTAASVPINPGVTFGKSTVKVKLTAPAQFFDIGFNYSCETCGPMSKDPQKVRVTVLQ